MIGAVTCEGEAAPDRLRISGKWHSPIRHLGLGPVVLPKPWKNPGREKRWSGEPATVGVVRRSALNHGQA